jgi:DNA-binding SARP family transcriptional activator
MLDASGDARPRLELLGSVRLSTPSGDVGEEELGGRQARVVFAYLTLHRATPVPTDELAEALWSEGPPPTWNAALRGIVSRVRRFLELAGLDEGTLTGADGCYRLRLPEGTWVDVEEALRAAIAAEQWFEHDLDGARVSALTALELTEQPLLPGLSGTWLDERRDALRQARVRALHGLARIHLASGDPDRAVRAAREAIAIAPVQEENHRMLMRAFDANGERGEALRVFERCRTLLADELGIDPSPRTTALYLELLGDRG